MITHGEDNHYAVDCKARARHPSLQRNELGLTIRDYEGSMSTLCAGCGHDSITAAIVRALLGDFDGSAHARENERHRCSSKTPAYFANGAHGFNSAHGRMPAIATGANAANRELTYVGISGDGDSLSIGLGHMCHAIRRNVKMVYIIENNGVYGLTKGQFSASADTWVEKQARRAERDGADRSRHACAQYRSDICCAQFSGDKEQLVPILKAALRIAALR